MLLLLIDLDVLLFSLDVMICDHTTLYLVNFVSIILIGRYTYIPLTCHYIFGPILFDDDKGL